MNPSLPRDIILFSTADWDNTLWTNKQHTAARLVKRGYRVLYVESIGLRRPVAGGMDASRVMGRLAKGAGGVKKVRDNLWVYSPIVIPFHSRAWVRAFNTKILCSFIRGYSKRIGFQAPIFWTYNPLSVELAGRLGESMLVYHCVDDLPSAPGMASEALSLAEQELVEKSDLVFTTSRKLQETRSKWNPGNTHYFPNVADFDHFSKARKPGPIPEDLKGIPSPRIGFIGAISDYKVDIELIARIAEAREDWHWVLIGTVGEGQPSTSDTLLRRPNIHLLRERPYDVLPEYLRGLDLCVLPSSLNDYTSSMFPMKFFEYLAAGKTIVSTDLPALREHSDVCVLVKDRDDFIGAVSDALNGKSPDPLRCLETARRYTWDKRLDWVEELLIKKWEEKRRSQ
ncbi:MAG: glycosyltransferase [Thermodesulfobacteriota bacterium]